MIAVVQVVKRAARWKALTAESEKYSDEAQNGFSRELAHCINFNASIMPLQRSWSMTFAPSNTRGFLTTSVIRIAPSQMKIPLHARVKLRWGCLTGLDTTNEVTVCFAQALRKQVQLRREAFIQHEP